MHAFINSCILSMHASTPPAWCLGSVLVRTERSMSVPITPNKFPALYCVVVTCVVVTCVVVTCVVVTCVVVTCVVVTCVVVTCVIFICFIVMCVIVTFVVLTCVILTCVILTCVIVTCVIRKVTYKCYDIQRCIIAGFFISQSFSQFMS